jgi:hypothetical protein
MVLSIRISEFSLIPDRTHRERKESYMRELEVTVDHLRRMYQRDVVRIRQENESLRDTLQAHGIQVELGSPVESFTPIDSFSMDGVSPESFGHTGGRSLSSNFNSMSPQSHTSSLHHPSGAPSQLVMPPSSLPAQQSSVSKALQHPQNNMHGLDYDDVGLGFVAEYERTPYLSPPPNQ